MSRSDYYSWLNSNVCQSGKIGLQWNRIAQWLYSICSTEAEMHLNPLTSPHPVGFKEKISYDYSNVLIIHIRVLFRLNESVWFLNCPYGSGH